MVLEQCISMVLAYFIVHSPEDCIPTTFLECFCVPLAICINDLLQHWGLVGTFEAMDAARDSRKVVQNKLSHKRVNVSKEFT